MHKRNEISLEKRVRIQLLRERAIAQVEISKCLPLSVQYAMDRLVITGLYVNMPRNGRKRVTAEDDGRKIMRESLNNRRKTSSSFAAELPEGFNKRISARAIRRPLHKNLV
ncbi:hypothetical protein Trydic_g1176 [Trypoxylus dichotomus]